MDELDCRVSPVRRWRSVVASQIGLTILALCLAGGPVAASPCTLDEAASIPASFKDGKVTVDAAVNGTPVKFRIDTGSNVTWINRSLAERLNLPIVANLRKVNTDAGTYRPDGVIVSELKIDHLA
jgi:predicted aspartyl protease